MHLRLLIKMSWEKDMDKHDELMEIFLNQLMLFQDHRRRPRKYGLPELLVVRRCRQKRRLKSISLYT